MLLIIAHKLVCHTSAKSLLVHADDAIRSVSASRKVTTIQEARGRLTTTFGYFELKYNRTLATMHICTYHMAEQDSALLPVIQLYRVRLIIPKFKFGKIDLQMVHVQSGDHSLTAIASLCFHS